MGPFYVTPTTYQNLLVETGRGNNPVTLGPIRIHQTKKFQPFHYFASTLIRLNPNLINLKAFGTDGEPELIKAFNVCFPSAVHLRCTLHMATCAPSRSSTATGAPFRSSTATGAPSHSRMATGAPSRSSMTAGAPSHSCMATTAPSRSSTTTGAPSRSSTANGAPSHSRMATGALSHSSMATSVLSHSRMTTGAPSHSPMASGTPSLSSMAAISGANTFSQLTALRMSDAFPFSTALPIAILP